MTNVFEKSTSLFEYVKRQNRFSATLTQLGCNGIDSKSAEFFQPLERGYGFVLVSAKTGAKTTMRLVKTNKIQSDWCPEDDDVKSWFFQPTNGATFSLEIINQ
jgi:hypothetical protein